MDGGRYRLLVATGTGGPRRVLPLVVALLTSIVLAPGAAADSSPGPGPGTTSPGSSSLSELRDSVAEQSEEVQAARDELTASAQAAARALEAYSVAVQAYQVAHDEQRRSERALVIAEQELTRSRVELGRWARQAYYAGSGLATNPSLVTLLGGTGDDVTYSQRLLASVGTRRERAVDATVQALSVQRAAAGTAQRAEQAAQSSLERAEQLRSARDGAVTAQRATLARLEAQLQSAQDVATQAEAQALRLAQARAYARQSAGGAGDNAVTGPVGTCAGGQTTLYANGEIPLDALCPLWAAPGQYLRADAAYAFDQLSTAYARQFGRPICVTDSYRSYAEQVAVKAAKPGLAATPGTSNHGWGTAVDLCGGIQSYDSEEHRWLSVNAPAFGWFLPSWADRNGSKPEPWHWEFGG